MIEAPGQNAESPRLPSQAPRVPTIYDLLDGARQHDAMAANLLQAMRPFMAMMALLLRIGGLSRRGG